MNQRLVTLLILVSGSSGLATGCAKLEHCGELKPGESLTVAESETKAPAKYRLKRLPDDPTGNRAYEIGLRLHFRPGRGVLISDVKKARDRIRACYQKSAYALRSTDGVRIEFRLLSENASDLPPAIDLSLKKDVERARSDRWPLELKCASILHESLHHTGLVDEYEELEKNYDCRHSGPSSSLMAGHEEIEWAISRQGMEQITEFVCECDPDTENKDELEQCKAGLKALSGAPQSCPAGSEERIKFSLITPDAEKILNSGEAEAESVAQESTDEKGDRKVDSRIYAMSPNEYFQSVKAGKLVDDLRYHFVKIEPAPEVPSLFPAHIRAIVYPGCKSKNELYYTCAENAYKRSSSVLGCQKDVPAACRSGDWLN